MAIITVYNLHSKNYVQRLYFLLFVMDRCIRLMTLCMISYILEFVRETSVYALVAWRSPDKPVATSANTLLLLLKP